MFVIGRYPLKTGFSIFIVKYIYVKKMLYFYEKKPILSKKTYCIKCIHNIYHTIDVCFFNVDLVIFISYN